MALSFLGLLQNQVNDDLVRKLARILGENPSNTKSALGSVLPVILTGLVEQSSNHDGAAALFDLAEKSKHEGTGFNAITETADDGRTLRDNSILNAIFGEQLESTVELIASTSGIRKSSCVSLLGMVAPRVVSLVGAHAHKQGVTDSAEFANVLAGQKGFLKGSFPAGLTTFRGTMRGEPVVQKNLSTESRFSLKNIVPFLPIIAIMLVEMSGSGRL